MSFYSRNRSSFTAGATWAAFVFVMVLLAVTLLITTIPITLYVVYYFWRYPSDQMQPPAMPRGIPIVQDHTEG